MCENRPSQTEKKQIAIITEQGQGLPIHTLANLKCCFKESDPIPALARLAKLLPFQGELQAGVVVTLRHCPDIF